MRRFRRIRFLAQYGAAVVAGFGLSLLPRRLRVGLCTAVARAAGRLYLDRVARRHFETAFGSGPSQDLWERVREDNARALGRLVAEGVEYARRGRALARELVSLDPTSHFLDEALARGRGAIVLTPHFGNWELFPAFMVDRGYEGAVVGRTAANPHLAKLLRDIRARAGVETIDSLRGQRRALEVLARGGIVGLLPDLDSKRVSGVFVEFFGRPAWTPTGPARLAIASGAPIVTSYVLPDGEGYRIEFESPLTAVPQAPRDAEVLRLTQAWSARFEARIRARPELWVWLHDRWATTPEKAEERRRRRSVPREFAEGSLPRANP